ncbi:hypothetical protein JCM24511_02335 [Saitozyma sp. JCM 24511]|nr:hypothetical protein JCM24511_02335 [Saitozyma sp. JCM 24511]
MARIDEAKRLFPDVHWVPLTHPDHHPIYHYRGFHPDTVEILPVGHRYQDGRRAFGVETVFQRDMSVPVRDGAILRADIFLPNGSDKVPAIIPWSPYGKTGTGPQNYDSMGPFRMGLPLDRTSGYEKFEAPDPAEWAERGYAVVNIDARGAGDSEGDISFWGPQEAEDIYDVIDWVSRQTWCNGSVVMAGNSWLAIAQINFTSRLKHPALKAVAPWECLTDPYVHFNMRGGRPHIPKFHEMLLGGFAGHGTAEDLPGAHVNHPLFDDFWASKKIHVENINVPIYQVASYSSQLHTRGSFEVFQKARSSRKWLRVHPYQEWYDLYRPEINDELQRYFDFYAKGLCNGWETEVPRVRLSLLGFDGSAEPTVIERPYDSYPIAETRHVKYHLDAQSGRLLDGLPTSQTTVCHQGHSLSDSSDFVLHFDRRTELHGLSKVKLWMSCPEHDDMDVVVQIRKIDKQGRPLAHLNYPCPVPEAEVPDVNIAKTLGPEGYLRVSHRNTVDKEASSDIDIVYRHDSREPILPGTIVPFEITLWPMGMVIGPGEGILLRVSGHCMTLPECPPAVLQEPDDENRGTHWIHTGSEYDSHLMLPVLP